MVELNDAQVDIPYFVESTLGARQLYPFWRSVALFESSFGVPCTGGHAVIFPPKFPIELDDILFSNYERLLAGSSSRTFWALCQHGRCASSCRSASLSSIKESNDQHRTAAAAYCDRRHFYYRPEQ